LSLKSRISFSGTRSPRTLHTPHTRAIAVSVLLALAGSGALLRPAHVHADGLPDLGDASDAIVSEPQERAIGKRIMLEIRGDRAFVEDPELSGYITQLGNRLIAGAPGATNDNRRDFEFFLLDDQTINAFALLGGFVGFHSGLVLNSANESELAGVMGHEISHVLQRHAARGAMGQRKGSLLSLLGLAAAIAAARSNSSSSGQATEAALIGSQALMIQNQLDYSRDFEREADRMGIQIMMRSGFDANGMVSFFDRLLRANRHNEGRTPIPGYLRTHPLTTERIADMQSRVDQLSVGFKAAPTDSIEYKFAHAKLRVMSLSNSDAISFFRNAIAERTILRNRADVYGLAFALTRARDFAAAERELNSIRQSPAPHPWLERLAAEIQVGQGRFDAGIQTYQDGLKRFPNTPAMTHGLIETLYASNQIDRALAMANEQLKVSADDPRLYELAAKGFERKGKKLAQHRAVGEAYYRRGNLIGAVEQLEIAAKAKDGDFYESSSVESRLREWKAELRNRTLLPGEKASDRDKEERDRERGRPGFVGKDVASPLDNRLKTRANTGVSGTSIHIC
jgi:beta-barrel assembly-enhancing protease